MKREEELVKQLTDMVKDTKAGKVHWYVICQTTEYNDAATKPTVEEDGLQWTVDECYVSYVCNYKGQDFCMITYEMLKTAGDKVQTTNLIFLPPMGIRVFHLQNLLPYAIPASNVLANQIHNLWELLLIQYKADKSSVYLDVIPGTLVIED